MPLVTLLVVALQLGSDPSELVERLGSPRFAEREAAASALQHLGRAAVTALRNGLASSDAEISARAEALLDDIETRMLVVPTMVKLDFKDQPLSAILSGLGSQVQTTITLTGDNAPAALQRKLTLVETEPVAFWDAIEQLCRTVPCQVGNGPAGGFGQPGPAPNTLPLVTVRPGVVPSCVSGPFRTTVFMIHHERNRVFFPGIASQMMFNAGIPGAMPPQPGRADPSKAAGEFQERFIVALQTLSEPRLSYTQTGPPRITTVVDENGQTLGAIDSANFPSAGFNMNGLGVGGGNQMIIPLSFGLPETHGKLIKRLKGEIPVLLHSRKDNPVSIKLAEAQANVVDSPALSVRVHDIKSGQNQPFISIDMTVRVKGTAVPDGAAPGGLGGEFAVFRNSTGQPQSQVEFVDAEGRPYPQWYTFNPQAANDGLRLTVRLMPGEGVGPPVALRFYDLARAQSTISFDLTDIPLP